MCAQLRHAVFPKNIFSGIFLISVQLLDIIVLCRLACYLFTKSVLENLQLGENVMCMFGKRSKSLKTRLKEEMFFASVSL